MEGAADARYDARRGSSDEDPSPPEPPGADRSDDDGPDGAVEDVDEPELSWSGSYWPAAANLSGADGPGGPEVGPESDGAPDDRGVPAEGDIHRDDAWVVDEAVPLFVSVPVGSIEPNEFQPRTRFVDEELEALAASILEVGLLQPVLLRRIDIDRYELIAGERRWRAAVRAGLTAVPAIVRPADDQSSLEQAVVENLHRADLNALEEAAAYRQLIEEFGLTQDAVAQRVGKSRSAVANLLRLFQLPTLVQRLITSGALGAGHARALLAFPDPEFQVSLANRVVREDLTVRRVEELVRQASQRAGEQGGGEERRGSSDQKPSAVLTVEELLAERLETRVEIATSGQRGRIVIEFADAEDLDRVAEVLLGRVASHQHEDPER